MIFSVEATGRVRALPLHQDIMCLRAVEAALPVCVVKAQVKVHLATGNNLNDRVWLSQIENSFFRNSARLSWVDDLTYMIIRFKLANTKLARFFPGWSLGADECNGSISDYGSDVVHVYRDLSKRAMGTKLRQIDARLAPREPGSPFDTRSRYSWAQQTVYVPLGIINSSVPSNATLFAFHLSRMAVRFFHSLTPLLWQEQTSLGASHNLQYTRRSQALFRELLNCLSRDFATVLRETRAEFDLDPDDARYALLAQTVAVAVAFVTFRELLHVERIWKLSFRLSTLPDLSSDQLFFVWYALDNCENSDPAYQIRQYETWKRLPPDLAVNFPLRHLARSFGEAFGCQPGSFMRPLRHSGTCNLFNSTLNDHVVP
ncbi:neprilysin-1-like [Dermacentor andersoni]|uniref:neprilysin-1-like n=1 Tax=Dermacentor andersoni TaxID=34620 RepID=UPI003B3B44A8